MKTSLKTKQNATISITCTRRIEFDAAHRVMGHENKCKYLHGHRYVVEATFEAPSLDKLGRVVDFGDIRKILGNWIDENWDHNTILCVRDNKLGQQIDSLTKQKTYYLEKNPTAENLAEYLLTAVCPKLFKSLETRCITIKIWETPNCSAEAKIQG